ncbi:MAG TPA: hypothetical protein VGL08_19395 [Paraburkholderia sp.]|jgi:hypothetical protein
MDRTNVPRRLLRLVGRLALWAASASLVPVAPALADQIEQHNQLVNQFVNDMHADPLVADCAAHGDFVASTSTAFDHVEFPPASFDSAHASVTPWNDSFDERKQRVKVDSIVTVEGLGIPSGSGSPSDLRFRCGYVGTQMLAFGWNDPVPPARPTHSSASRVTGTSSVKGKHTANGKTSAKKHAGKTSKSSTAAKSGSKPVSKPSGKSSGKTSSAKSGAHKASSATSKKKH